MNILMYRRIKYIPETFGIIDYLLLGGLDK
jgi:hypothetical protein